ncbi:MAG TPA: hypothetical protein VF492_00590, partial [Verrucomicrobiae bacterium]
IFNLPVNTVALQNADSLVNAPLLLPTPHRRKAQSQDREEDIICSGGLCPSHNFVACRASLP